MAETKLHNTETLTIEALFAQLEQISAQLEQSDTSLEDSFELYKAGVELVKACGDKIDTIEKQMILLNEEEHA